MQTTTGVLNNAVGLIMRDRGQSELPLATQSALLFGANIQALRPPNTPNNTVPAAFTPPIQL
eukprot:12983884-Alexandrium_andersonii.AAC.1